MLCMNRKLIASCSLLVLIIIGSACAPSGSSSNACADMGLCAKPKTIPAVLVFIPTTLQLKQNECGRLFLRSNPEAASNVAVQIKLTSTATSGGFYADPNCTAAITSVTLETKQTDTVPFFYKDSSLGNPTLKGAAPGAVASLTATIE